MKTMIKVLVLILFSTLPSYAADYDGDGIDDIWEITWLGNLTTANAISDYDNDGLSDLNEYLLGTYPIINDTDGDNIWDGWEINNGLNPTNHFDGAMDFDSDGLVNSNEFVSGCNLNVSDTDNDGLPDGWEFFNGLNPTNSLDVFLDSDGDSINNSNEFVFGTCPTKIDTDCDGLTDSNEYYHVYQIWTCTNKVRNAWVLTNILISSTIATNFDTDNDGFNDFEEIYAGTNPNDPNDYMKIKNVSYFSNNGTNYIKLFWKPSASRGYCMEITTNLYANEWIKKPAIDESVDFTVLSNLCIVARDPFTRTTPPFGETYYRGYFASDTNKLCSWTFPMTNDCSFFRLKIASYYDIY